MPNHAPAAAVVRRSRPVALALAGLLGLAAAPSKGAAPPAPASDLERRVDDLMTAQMRRYGIVGAAVGIARAGETLVLRPYGSASLELGVPVVAETVFQISSTTKVLAGTVAALLVQEGKLDPAAPAERYLDDLPPGWRTITVEQLLGHLSGLPDVVEVSAETAAEAQAAIAGRPLAGEPGERWSYNQTNYMLVQRIIETLEERPFTEVVERRLLVPLVMTRTRWGSQLDLVPGRATSYSPRAGADATATDPAVALQLRDYDFPPYLQTAAGYNSSAPDLLRFLAALDAGEPLAPAVRDRMWTPLRTRSGEPTSYGWGWPSRGAGRRRSVGHEGGGRSTVRYYPDSRIAVVLLTNGWRHPFQVDAVAEELAALVDPSLLAPAARLASEMLRAIEGGDLAAATKLHAAHRAAAPDESTEGAINDLGYSLLRLGRGREAIAVLALNAASYPDSANVWDSLGEAHLEAGDLDAAERHYRRALELDPGSRNAERMLARVAEARKAARE